MENSIFEVLVLLGRPAAGKSEIIDHLRNTQLTERIRKYHIGEIEVIDDFPMLWTWFEEDDILSQKFGKPRLHSDEFGYFKYQYLWNVLIERIGLEYHKRIRDNQDLHQHTTVIIEFSRGSEHGGYAQAFEYLTNEILSEAGIVYVQVSFEESMRKNRIRFNPARPDSILEHGLQNQKIKRLYQEDDWSELTRKSPDYLSLQGYQVPYSVFENEDDVTTPGGELLSQRLSDTLDRLWHLKKNPLISKPAWNSNMQSPISSNPKIVKLYEGVPQESLKRLQEFRIKYPYQEVSIGDYNWNFIDSGEGEDVLFIPAGGTAIAEVSFNSLEHFAQHHRVIAPDYPPIEDLQELFEGFIKLLDQLGVGDFSTMGGSYGGWMVQSFVRQYPERIKKLVISAVGPPNKENSDELARLMGWLRITPTVLLRWMINRSFARLERSRNHKDEMALLWALVREAVYFRLGRADILALLQRLINQTDDYSFSADDLEDWLGKILLVFGSEDPATPAEKRQAMVDLYPKAEFKVFEGGEHGIAITHQQEYFQVIDEFLAR